MKEFKHTCQQCGFVWTSQEKTKISRVDIAASVNGQGPYCLLCYHLEMALRLARSRGLSETAERIEILKRI